MIEVIINQLMYKFITGWEPKSNRIPKTSKRGARFSVI